MGTFRFASVLGQKDPIVEIRLVKCVTEVGHFPGFLAYTSKIKIILTSVINQGECQNLKSFRFDINRPQANGSQTLPGTSEFSSASCMVLSLVTSTNLIRC